VLERHDGLFRGGFHSLPPTRQFFAPASGTRFQTRFLVQPSAAVSLRGVVRLPGDPGGFLFIIAKMNSEGMQALPKSHLCSFEPQRHHRNALSGLSHFPQLLVRLGFPYSSGVLCTPDHFTTRSPHRRAGAPLGIFRGRQESNPDQTQTQLHNRTSTQLGEVEIRSGPEQLSRPDIDLAGRCLLPEAPKVGLRFGFGGTNGRSKEKERG